jgi:hypothetical protein
MATPSLAPPPDLPSPVLRVGAPEPRDDARRPQPPRRPDRELPSDLEMQRWLDLSG